MHQCLNQSHTEVTDQRSTADKRINRHGEKTTGSAISTIDPSDLKVDVVLTNKANNFKKAETKTAHSSHFWSNPKLTDQRRSDKDWKPS